MKARIVAYLGSIIGSLGWMIGFTVVCLASGNAEVLGRVAFTGFSLSLGMAGIFIMTSELTLRTFGLGGMFQLILWGELTFFMGVLMLLLNYWIAPILESSPSMMDTMRRMGGYSRTGDFFPAALLAASVILTAIVVARLLRQAGRSKEG